MGLPPSTPCLRLGEAQGWPRHPWGCRASSWETRKVSGDEPPDGSDWLPARTGGGTALPTGAPGSRVGHGRVYRKRVE